MRKYLFPFFAYLKYWLVKEDRYAIQSPLVFDLYNGLLIFIKDSIDSDSDLEIIRNELLADPEILYIEDFGVGSKKLKDNLRKTSSVTKYSTSSRKFSKLYQYFCLRTPAKTVLELGTCVGINTRYLSKTTKGQLLTFEGSDSLWKKAQESGIPDNTQYLLGNINKTLSKKLQEFDNVDFVLIDATHSFNATKHYFESLIPYIQEDSIIAVADIHWSGEMTAAWKEIKRHPLVILSIDFYECGILIFDKKYPKGAYILHY
ncbi:O-methyltransferase [Aquiflexum sp.]|uniref:O-methyltransferase n=1 Tax=Aquiflexum sp. TaxID=1872584 RepID=UPI003593BFC5